MDPGIPVITQLEAMAAATVVVNWCTFFFAWEKPLDARSHILILIKATASPSTHHDRYQLRGPDTIVTEDFEREENLSGSQGTERRIQLEFPELESTSISKSIASFRITPLALLSTLFWPITSISIDLFTKLVPDEGGPSEFPDGTLKIPLFYVQNTMPQHTVLLPAITVGAGVSIFFLLLRPGSILYLSSWAARLWWAASISSTMLSVCMLASAILASVFYLLTFPLSPSNCMHACLTGLSNLFKSPFLSTLSLWLGLFFFYRVVSLAAAVISFRSTVGVVFWGRSWVDYIPHFSWHSCLNRPFFLSHNWNTHFDCIETSNSWGRLGVQIPASSVTTRARNCNGKIKLCTDTRSFHVRGRIGPVITTENVKMKFKRI